MPQYTFRLFDSENLSGVIRHELDNDELAMLEARQAAAAAIEETGTATASAIKVSVCVEREDGSTVGVVTTRSDTEIRPPV